MRGMRVKPIFLLFIVILVTCVACGGGAPAATQEAATSTVAPVEPTETSAPTPTSVPEGLVTQLSDLKKATIQIEAQGTFIDPEFGYISGAGRGSGFIIDSSGIAITNNHVVTGAALLKVWVGGDTSKTYNAKILGVSECSDLAVIDIDGDGFSYLEWYDGPATVGLEIYTAGYPLGDPEFTMTKGIVSKEKADGETYWASVDSVIEHTAATNPGSSGGPLVDAEAKVVGIHYSGASSTDQHFAIDRETALPVINQLRSGKDVDSIGINGMAVSNDDGSVTGIWVSSVKSGSSADTTGVKAGDIILSMENLALATDGTMKDYCDILRTHNAGDTLAIEVLRWQNQEVLDGQLNGRTLEMSYSLAEPTKEPIVAEPTAAGTGTNLPANCDPSDTSGFITCWDDSGYISVDVPDYWNDVNGSAWTFGGETIGFAINAAPSLSDYSNYYDSEGVFFGASDTFAQIGGYVEFLDYYKSYYDEDCTWVDRYDYDDGVYYGKYDIFTDCGGPSDYETYVLSAVDSADTTSMIILVEISIYYTDTYIIDQIWGTFLAYF